jgi:hypothetical protein
MDKELDALMFAVNEKANKSNEIMNQSTSDIEEYNFHKGQFQAYSEVYTMLDNIRQSL